MGSKKELRGGLSCQSEQNMPEKRMSRTGGGGGAAWSIYEGYYSS